MRLGIFARTFPGHRPEDVLAQAASAGYVAVQYNMVCSGLESLPESVTEAEANAVAAAAANTGVEIAAVSATWNMVHPDPAVRARGRRAFEAIASSAGRMGIRLVTLCTGSLNAADQWAPHPENGSAAAWRTLLQEFEAILPVAERCGLSLGVEPEPGNVVSSARRARDLLDALRSDRVRIVLDAANLLPLDRHRPAQEILDDAIDRLGEWIALAHAKDRTADGRVAAPGEGTIDFRGYLASLRASGFDGALVAHGFRAEAAGRVAAFLREQGAGA